MTKLIDTDSYSSHLRSKSIDVENKKLLVTSFSDSGQKKDLSVPPNCDGFGRIRHFYRATTERWPENPLPIDPAEKFLGLSTNSPAIESQVFQNAACNWRCWYCFVPFNLLSANVKHSAMLSCRELVDLYMGEENRPSMIDLSGGQPDLIPEWVPWMMRELMDRGLEETVYLWSDDNLSNDYFWQYLSNDDIELVAGYTGYGRVCCFKGFDDASFSFNTLAEPSLFARQFDLFSRLANLGIDLYAYATFTTTDRSSVEKGIPAFLDLLQSISVNLPLRTIPLEVQVFSPVESRLDEEKRRSMDNQWHAIDIWKKEIESRFSADLREKPITEIPLR